MRKILRCEPENGEAAGGAGPPACVNTNVSDRLLWSEFDIVECLREAAAGRVLRNGGKNERDISCRQRHRSEIELLPDIIRRIFVLGRAYSRAGNRELDHATRTVPLHRILHV